MRNEFAGRVAEIPALAELFNQGVHWLLPPDRQARREMILGPARRAGLKLEGGDNGRLIIGGLLVLIGGSMLANRYLPWMEDLILPADGVTGTRSHKRCGVQLSAVF